jgi:hypothetical protein
MPIAALEGKAVRQLGKSTDQVNYRGINSVKGQLAKVLSPLLEVVRMLNELLELRKGLQMPNTS